METAFKQGLYVAANKTQNNSDCKQDGCVFLFHMKEVWRQEVQRCFPAPRSLGKVAPLIFLHCFLVHGFPSQG